MSLISRHTPEMIEVAGRMVAAVLASGLIGLNREINHKPAGLKTHALVGLGSCLMAVLGMHLAESGSGHNADAASRVIQGLVSGIGFLGGGVILHTPDKVRGLTTAASVWLAACLGIACGLGAWLPVLFASFLTLAILVIGNPIEEYVDQRWGYKHQKKNPKQQENPSDSNQIDA